MAGVSPDQLPPDAPARAERLRGTLDALPSLQGKDRLVIGIAGESGSGKSVAATALAESYSAAGRRAMVIYQDHYFVRPPRTNHEYRLHDLSSVGPQEVDLALIGAHLEAFRRAEPLVTAPRVDYPGNRFLTQEYDFRAVEVLIIEGTYVLSLPALDARVFLEATHLDTAERRRARNRDIDAPIIQDILAIEHRLIAQQGALADVRIDPTFTIRTTR